jgi:hypothetical protein
LICQEAFRRRSRRQTGDRAVTNFNECLVAPRRRKAASGNARTATALPAMGAAAELGRVEPNQADRPTRNADRVPVDHIHVGGIGRIGHRQAGRQRRGRASRRGANGYELRQQQQAAPGPHGIGAQLRGRHSVDHQSAPGARGRSEAAARASKNWRSACPSVLGAPSCGGKAPT